MKSFLGATSKELLHYVDPTLKDGIYNMEIIHVSNNKNTNKADELVKNLESTAKMYFEWYSRSCSICYCY